MRSSEKVKRLTIALKETQRQIDRESKYSSHLQNKVMLEKFISHKSFLENELDALNPYKA